jgi:hypothetical protein
MKTGAPDSAAKAATAKRRAGANNRSEPMPDPARRVADPEPAASEAVPRAATPASRASHAAPRGSGKSDGLDGFRVEVDAARHRLDIVLDRPPLNVITMNQREQLRVAFEAADAGSRVRVIVVRGSASIFRAAARSAAFSKPRPSISRVSPGTSRHRRGAGSRLSRPAAAIVSGSASSWLWPATSGSSPRHRSTRCRSSGSA